MKQNLRRILLCAMLVGLPLVPVSALDWYSEGEEVTTYGPTDWATTNAGATYDGFDIVSGDYVDDITPNTSFFATITNPTLDIYGDLYDASPAAGGALVLDGGDPIPCPLKINGDVLIQATSYDATVNINEPVMIEPYYNPDTTTWTDPVPPDVMDCSHVQFDAGDGYTITVNVDHDLTFRGMTVNPSEHLFRNLIVSFRGRGSTIFNMADGTAVWFTGQTDENNPMTYNAECGIFEAPRCGSIPDGDFSNFAGGTHVLVLMDQTLADVDSGKNKVVFQRQALDGDFNTDRVLIGVGPNSIVTYLSDCLTGLPEDCSTLGYGTIAFDPSNNGTGRMVLYIQGAYYIDWDEYIVDDQGNYLDEEGEILPDQENTELFVPNPNYGMVTEKYPFNDGAFIVAGNCVNEGGMDDPGILSGCANDDNFFLPGYDFTRPAGVRAIVRVVDNKHFEEAPIGVPYAPEVIDRRGLLVVNDVANHGKLASDPYWDLYNDEADPDVWGMWWAYSMPQADAGYQDYPYSTRFGCVVGVNGRFDICHNTFLHHVSGSVNQLDPTAAWDYADPSGPFGVLSIASMDMLKMRNPSALIIDGLDPRLFSTLDSGGNPFILDGEENPSASEFVAANPWTQASPVQGEVLCRGNGTLYTGSGASSPYGYLYNLWNDETWQLDPEDPWWNYYNNPWEDPTLDWTRALWVGDGWYDGYSLVRDPNNLLPHEIIPYQEGYHVLDVEGPLKVWSIANNTAYSSDNLGPRTYSPVVENSGVVEMASLLLNHQGRETLWSDLPADLITRPLLLGTPGEASNVYARYNSPTMFYNNMAGFYNSILAHTDVTKYVDGKPAFSEPAVTGAERLVYALTSWGDYYTVDDPDRYRMPELQFYNSELQFQESCNASGVRFIARDPLGSIDHSGDNTSVFRFYDHGDTLDTNLLGFGRIFQCGSNLNTMGDPMFLYFDQECLYYADEILPNPYCESCYIDVYRRNALPGTDPLTNASLVKLSLQNGDQFHPDDLAAPGFDTNLKRAHHIIALTRPPTTDAGALCQMCVGWRDAAGTPNGDACTFPCSYPYLGEPVTPVTAVPFDLDALQVPPASVSVDGSIMCFTSWDEFGGPIGHTVRSIYEPGVIFCNHGGEFTTTRPQGTADPFARTSVPYQSVFSTYLANRVWSDYDAKGTTRDVHYSGQVDLPGDQVEYWKRFGVQPYNFTETMFDARRAITGGLTRLDYHNPERDPDRDESGAEEVVVDWFWKVLPEDEVGPEVKSINVNRSLQYQKSESAIRKFIVSKYKKDGRGHVKPIKTSKIKALLAAPWARLRYGIKARGNSLKLQTWGNTFRDPAASSTESVATPAERPTDILFVGAGDDISQMKVAGATMSDPFVLLVSGDPDRPNGGRVREFVSFPPIDVDFRIVGEGQHAVLFGDHSGRIGLGSREFDEFSGDAWNQLGKDYVTIVPLGNMTVDVNDDLYIADRLPIIASDVFGSTEVQRLTFYSENEHEIRVPAGGEIDLSSFGHSEYRQEIVFGGKVKLVLEEGARLRLPENPTGAGVVLYFNDDSQLIFEPSQRQAEFQPFDDVETAQRKRIRILGKGQIWINKDAEMQVKGNVFVGVQTDDLTTESDIVISAQRQGAVMIGDDKIAGGAFEVGNVEDKEGHSINFKLRLGGRDAVLHIDREGFFGLGAGILNKGKTPNGAAAVTDNPVVVDGVATTVEVGGVTVPVFNPDTVVDNGAWQVKALYNVATAHISLFEGIIDHNNIYDGSSNRASLMAIGQATEFIWDQANQNVVFVRGGGNIMYVPAAPAEQVYTVNIWDYAGPVYNGENYNILASGQLLLDRQEDYPTADYPTAGQPGKTFVITTPIDFFNFLSYEAFNLQGTASGKKVVLSENEFVSKIALTSENPTGDLTGPEVAEKYPVGAQIIRTESPAHIGGEGTLEEALKYGALAAFGDNMPFNYYISR